MRQFTTIVASLAACLAAFAMAAQKPSSNTDEKKFDEKKFEAFKRAALQKETTGAWKKIDWQPDIETALKKAGESKKPILAVLIVGHQAQKNAAEC